MSNWDVLLAPAREGRLPTMLPPDLKLPMVAPADLGRAAARLLGEPADRTGIHCVEGPDRYASGDVAAAFASALGRPVAVDLVPREAWEPAFRRLGFSAAAARSFARMTALSLDGGFAMPDHPERGATPLQDYIARLVASERASERPTRPDPHQLGKEPSCDASSPTSGRPIPSTRSPNSRRPSPTPIS